MNTELVTLLNGKAFTTTLAIAEGTELEHASIIKLVRTYLVDLEEFGLVRFEIRPRLAGQHGGGDVEYALLNEQQSTLLLTYMRNTDIVRGFKKRLVKAFWEMANQLVAAPTIDPMQVLSDPAAMRSLLLTYTEKVLDLEAAVSVLKPKAEITDRIAEADGALGLQAAAKALQQRPNKFTEWLRQKGWIYRRPGGSANLGYQDKIQAGYLTHKVHTIHKDDGTDKVVEQVLITAKGITKLADELNKKEQGNLLA